VGSHYQPLDFARRSFEGVTVFPPTLGIRLYHNGLWWLNVPVHALYTHGAIPFWWFSLLERHPEPAVRGGPVWLEDRGTRGISTPFQGLGDSHPNPFCIRHGAEGVAP